MMSFLKTLFGLGDTQATARKLSHPEDLREGDIIKFGYIPQPDLSNADFEVTQINTYIYGDLCYPELVLKDRSGNLIYMMVEEEDGEEYLAICKKIPKIQMDDIIGNDTMEKILARGTGTKVKVLSKPAGLEEWLVDTYREVDDDVKGAFVKGDVRYLSIQEINRQEKFTSYILEDNSEEYAIEIECYSTGETEACVTVYHDINAIEEMWPGNAPAETSK